MRLDHILVISIFGGLFFGGMVHIIYNIWRDRTYRMIVCLVMRRGTRRIRRALPRWLYIILWPAMKFDLFVLGLAMADMAKETAEWFIRSRNVSEKG